jgi:hypothetical protein
MPLLLDIFALLLELSADPRKGLQSNETENGQDDRPKVVDEICITKSDGSEVWIDGWYCWHIKDFLIDVENVEYVEVGDLEELGDDCSWKRRQSNLRTGDQANDLLCLDHLEEHVERRRQDSTHDDVSDHKTLDARRSTRRGIRYRHFG